MLASAAVADPSVAGPALMQSGASSADLSPTALLTRGLAAGDEEAFRRFHAEYFDRLLRYHLVLARGDEQAARDALQETLSRVARKTKQFACEHAFWNWLALLARCAAIDGGRRRQRYWAFLEKYAASWFQSLPASEPDHEARLHELLDQGLGSLAPDERELIEAKYFSGATVRGLAQQAGLTEKAMESRLRRLRLRLREQLVFLLRNERSR